MISGGAEAAEELLVRIVAPHFVAGLVLIDGKVSEAAPIIRYMLNWTSGRVRHYCNCKGYSAKIVRAIAIPNGAMVTKSAALRAGDLR